MSRLGLAARLGWDVGNQELFAQALAHRSWCAEHPGREPNERLEFLGDAVLGLVVTDYLYRTYPDLPEGELAKARAAVVNSASLAGTARELQLGNALFLGKGEDSSGGRLKLSILADAMEALIGAIYLDAGYGTVNGIVLQLLGERLRESAKGPGDEDYKTRLQELCAQTYDELPVYRIADSGPDHAKVFHAEVSQGAVARQGRGTVEEAGGAGGRPVLVASNGRSVRGRPRSRPGPPPARPAGEPAAPARRHRARRHRPRHRARRPRAAEASRPQLDDGAGAARGRDGAAGRRRSATPATPSLDSRRHRAGGRCAGTLRRRCPRWPASGWSASAATASTCS